MLIGSCIQEWDGRRIYSTRMERAYKLWTYVQALPVNGGHKCAPWVPVVDDGTTCCEKIGRGNVLSSHLCHKTKNALKRGVFLKSQNELRLFGS